MQKRLGAVGACLQFFLYKKRKPSNQGKPEEIDHFRKLVMHVFFHVIIQAY